MTKKHYSIAKLISCAVLAFMMMFSMTVPALAEHFSSGKNAGEPAAAVLTKIFKIPANTTIPDATFTFTFEPVGVNGGTNKDGMPKLGNDNSITISFKAGQKATFEDNGTQYFVAQSEDILGKLSKDGTAWGAGAGIYKYTVKEVRGSGIVLGTDSEGKEFTYYSEAEYDIEIWVEEDENGILFPMYIVGYYKEGTPDEYYPETPGVGKLNPTPGGSIPGTPGEIGERYSQIIFTNRYWKTDGPIDPDPNKNALEITKQVTGNNPKLDMDFTFNVTIVTPDAVGDTKKEYFAYIVDKDGKYVALGVNGNLNTADGTSKDPAADYIKFTSDIAKTVYLKHGERLVFFGLEVGADVRVFEKIEENTRVKYKRTFVKPGVEFNMPVGTTGTWGFPRDPEDKGPHYTIEGTGANIVTFTNNMGGNPPTGISVDNLPYVVLIALAIASLTGFVVFRFRKRANYDV